MQQVNSEIEQIKRVIQAELSSLRFYLQLMIGLLAATSFIILFKQANYQSPVQINQHGDL